MENILEYNKWEDKLWALYNSIFKDASYTIRDGVIFPDKYASTPFKVMIMNREAYDEDHSSYSLNQDGIAKEIGEGIIPFKKQKTLRCRLRQYLSLIHLLSNKGFNEVSEKEVIDFVNQSDNDDLVYYLSDAAYINIKKSDGKKRSVRSDLKEYAKKGIEVLKEQIRYCNHLNSISLLFSTIYKFLFSVTCILLTNRLIFGVYTMRLLFLRSQVLYL